MFLCGMLFGCNVFAVWSDGMLETALCVPRCNGLGLEFLPHYIVAEAPPTLGVRRELWARPVASWHARGGLWHFCRSILRVHCVRMVYCVGMSRFLCLGSFLGGVWRVMCGKVFDRVCASLISKYSLFFQWNFPQLKKGYDELWE